MNISFIKRAWIIALIFIPINSFTQECLEYYREGDCTMDINRSYKIYSQSKSFMMSPLDSVDLNIVMYGQKDYIFSFCTHAKLYPIHFRFIDPETQKILYDNLSDNFIESVGMGFNVTRNLTVRINLLARRATDDEISEKIGCVGMLIQYKNYFAERRHVQY